MVAGCKPPNWATEAAQHVVPKITKTGGRLVECRFLRSYLLLAQMTFVPEIPSTRLLFVP